MSSPFEPNPAAGERRAVRGLSAQYRVSASLVYDALRQGELEWVRLVDPNAGRLDDVVIARPGRLDAYQIKWSAYRNVIRFRDLVTDSKVSGKSYPAPFRLMADGWRRLRAAFPTRRIHAHYLMHDGPSAQEKANEPGQGRPAHLQSFLRNAFPYRAHWHEPNDSVYTTWFAKIDAITAATGLSAGEFRTFIVDCELDLGFDLPEPSSLEQRHQKDDVEALAYFFMKRVSDSSGPIELRRNDILKGVGWSDRFELRFKHDFPVDERLYRPIEETVEMLDGALRKFRQGYVALVGTPGSGKSTTLTQTLRYREGIRLIRYYAFVRDDPRVGRGDATTFVHDLCLSLEQLGVGLTRRFAALPETLSGLRERLSVLLGELGEDAARNGARAIILIDGLDHIEREQSPERSLIEELPPPNVIPDGVLIILGSQPIGLAGSSPALRPIRAQLKEPGRILTMRPLSRPNVHSIVRLVVPNQLVRHGDEDIIYRLSAGHPLALAYLVKRLSAAPDPIAAATLLDGDLAFGADIEAEYSAYWDRLHGDHEIRDLLALLSRTRGAVQVSTLKLLATESTLDRFVKSAFYLFQQLTTDRWSFFHNSFRQFLLRNTGLDVFGQPDAAKSEGYHRTLASAAGDSTAPVELRWDCLYHLEHAGDIRSLVDQAQQRVFREQFLAGRPLADIREDIERSLNAAAKLQDVVAVARLLLIDKEIVERKEALSQVNLTELTLDLADPTQCASLLMMGDDLLAPDIVALRWAVRFSDEGDASFASKLFDAAEPIEALAGVERVDPNGDMILDVWASSV